ncbi:hypothetical protein ACVDG5_007850 [Mesorhizobium sp. ORM6]
MMAVIAMSPIDLTKGRARLSQSGAKGNRAAPNSAASPIHEAQISVIISHTGGHAFQVMLVMRGAKQEEFRHVRVERYRQSVPNRGGVPDVVRQSAVAAKGQCAFTGLAYKRIASL